MIAYRSDFAVRPFSCNLNNGKIFSCVLGHKTDLPASTIELLHAHSTFSLSSNLVIPSLNTDRDLDDDIAGSGL